MSGLGVHDRFADLPLWEITRAIWRVVRGERRGRVKKMNSGHPLTLPAIRRAARAGREALSQRGEGDNADVTGTLIGVLRTSDEE